MSVDYIESDNKLLAFFGFGGRFVCREHGDVGDSPFHTCWQCVVQRENARRESEREARIEEMAEAFRRANVCRADDRAKPK